MKFDSISSELVNFQNYVRQRVSLLPDPEY